MRRPWYERMLNKMMDYESPFIWLSVLLFFGIIFTGAHYSGVAYRALPGRGLFEEWLWVAANVVFAALICGWCAYGFTSILPAKLKNAPKLTKSLSTLTVGVAIPIFIFIFPILNGRLIEQSTYATFYLALPFLAFAAYRGANAYLKKRKK